MKITISSLSAVVLVLSLILVIPAHASILDVREQFKVPEFDLSIATLLAIATISILIFRLISFGFLSFIYTFFSFIGTFVKRKGKIDRFPKMSIIIPAYNEEITVASSIKSMLNLNYPDYEVIVVDDGSSDNTFNEAWKYSEKGVKVIRQKNTGKPGAINTGIKNASGEIVITVDADSKLHPDALTWIARRFSGNPRLGAVAGNVKIDKPTGLLKTLQSLEYTTSINLIRKSQSVLHCVMIVPGAIAALKTTVIHEVGYFPSDTFAEDFDITMKILKAGYHVEYESRAIAFTQAPESIEDFLKQRRRWYRGIPQVLSKYQGMYLNPKYGTAGMFGVPLMWLGVSSYLMNMFLLFILLADTFSYIVSSSSYDLNLLTWGMLVYWALTIGISAYAVLLDPMPKIREIIASPLYLFYNVFIDGVGLMALIEELLSVAMRWEKPKREELE
ncbi:glycosyltransferase [Candidatus Methanoperedens nitratireducens]|uniref:Putative Glucosaminyltransferase n=1 Tax=Candidatus Methanoperedens nitratireducens TaxID=1392998 RepID=A0A284VQC1_9EURY|nr:glycosyltransferase [Candidatus Methanoperedens nitroreducens]SNQ61462.1 putative Glucosaminyltransferase [Candidatus Methanoperedens nitroreducens]